MEEIIKEKYVFFFKECNSNCLFKIQLASVITDLPEMCHQLSTKNYNAESG